MNSDYILGSLTTEKDVKTSFALKNEKYCIKKFIIKP